MAKKPSEIAHEVERGEILRYLAEVYPASATPRTLLHHLDYSGYSITEAELGFHLTYLAQKGFIRLEASAQVGKEHEIRIVAITPEGIDLLDRRKRGESGVRF